VPVVVHMRHVRQRGCKDRDSRIAPPHVPYSSLLLHLSFLTNHTPPKPNHRYTGARLSAPPLVRWPPTALFVFSARCCVHPLSLDNLLPPPSPPQATPRLPPAFAFILLVLGFFPHTHR
jgi:hypothetical protein